MALSLVRKELSTMRLPSLTTSPPMMAGSTLMSRSTSLPVTDLSAARSVSTCCDLSCSATVTSAVTSPLCLATRSRNALIMSRTANSRRFATTSLKIRGQPTDAGALEHCRQCLQLLIGGEHRAAHQPHQVRTPGDERIETVELAFHRLDRIRFPGEIE